MTWWQALLSGIIQGLTEFIPVSSSGHLVIFNQVFGDGAYYENIAFTVFLHFGTLVAVIAMFFKDVLMLIKEFFASMWDLIRGKPNFKTPERKLLLMIILASIPVTLVGVGLEFAGWTQILDNIFVTAAFLFVTAILLMAIHNIGKNEKGEGTNAENTPLKRGFFVGAAQAVAIFPGLSRSGTTIFAARKLGLSREFAVRFSFLMSIPVIFGANLFYLFDFLGGDGLDIHFSALAIGFLASLIFGILAIKLVKVLIKTNRFYLFAIYCIIAALAALAIGIFM